MRRLTILVLALLIMPATLAEARSVHSTEVVDMFPQGNMQDSTDWDIKRHLAFTGENLPDDAEHVFGMVADNHMTLGINLPEHFDDQMIWSSSTPTNSNASIGSPDGAYSWSTGPDITLAGFSVSGLTSNAIQSVELVVHFNIPDPLLQDKTRFSVIDEGNHDLVKTWSNTQSGLYYMENGWSVEIFDDDNWTWDELANLEVTLDYVSNGGTDDSQLQVDAVGLKVTMLTPWYGAERVTATSINQFTEWPIIDLDIASGQLSSVSTAPCGLSSDGGTWTTDSIAKPAAQSWGRIHFEHDDSNGTIGVEYVDNQGAWVSIQPGLIPTVSGDLQLRFTITDTCLTRAWVDVNDPHIRIVGSIAGDNTSMVESATRWTLVVNGETVANNDGTAVGSFDIQVPIGHVLDSSDTELEIKIKAWYNWGNDGSPATLSLVINNLEIIGAYSIEYDEDPVCGLIGSHDLVEDMGGTILPLISTCSDDRTDSENLNVQFQNSNPEIVEVDLTEGQIRVKLVPEASGTATITAIVSDPSGNYWSETFNINVANVNDKPDLAEFIGVVPVEHDHPHVIPFTLSDSDSFAQDLTVTTNRSWAIVNLTDREIVVTAPNVGLTTILVTACDESSCSERVLELEVRALAELVIESIEIDETVNSGDIFEVKVYVRNEGQVTASLVGIRCTADGQPIGFGVIEFLMPGQLGSFVCEMQAPDGDDSLLILAEVDRSNNIDEINENNNNDTRIISIIPAADEDDTSNNQKSSNENTNPLIVYITSGVVVLVILVLFSSLAPSKIRKVE
ncbi:MAG: hypothetical protein DWC02_04505 [Candidatus Poseidoniales archaeon]|nr:MAG: hypothetical protein DWC02_04505 [Candidatus Poseidoniales archaeon]